MGFVFLISWHFSLFPWSSFHKPWGPGLRNVPRLFTNEWNGKRPSSPTPSFEKRPGGVFTFWVEFFKTIELTRQLERASNYLYAKRIVLIQDQTFSMLQTKFQSSHQMKMLPCFDYIDFLEMMAPRLFPIFHKENVSFQMQKVNASRVVCCPTICNIPCCRFCVFFPDVNTAKILGNERFTWWLVGVKLIHWIHLLKDTQ